MKLQKKLAIPGVCITPVFHTAVSGPSLGHSHVPVTDNEFRSAMATHDIFTHIDGLFYRATDPEFRQYALSGSVTAGRYSAFNQPTLYLSSSPEGVEAAMLAHRDQRAPASEILRIRVTANNIFDLRDPQARQFAGIDIKDAIAPWQEIVAAGNTPRSWLVRKRLEALGAAGLIDPSRKAPGLWHLVLFQWNQGAGVSAELA